MVKINISMYNFIMFKTLFNIKGIRYRVIISIQITLSVPFDLQQMNYFIYFTYFFLWIRVFVTLFKLGY